MCHCRAVAIYLLVALCCLVSNEVFVIYFWCSLTHIYLLNENGIEQARPVAQAVDNSLVCSFHFLPSANLRPSCLNTTCKFVFSTSPMAEKSETKYRQHRKQAAGGHTGMRRLAREISASNHTLWVEWSMAAFAMLTDSYAVGIRLSSIGTRWPKIATWRKMETGMALSDWSLCCLFPTEPTYFSLAL